MSYMEAFPKAMICYTEEVWVRNGVFVNPRKKHKKHSGWIFEKVLPLCLLSLSSALFRREVFEVVGSFDESMPACEDYDLGIRLAHKFPIHLIDLPLIVKRGGHADQLSRQFWGMDRFRVYALEKALEMDPNYVKAYNNLGASLAQVDREEDAIDAFKRAIEVDPEYVNTYKNLAMAYISLRRVDPAIKTLKRYLALNPDDTNAQEILDKLYIAAVAATSAPTSDQ